MLLTLLLLLRKSAAVRPCVCARCRRRCIANDKPRSSSSSSSSCSPLSLSFHLPLCSAVCTCFGAVLVATGDELSGESFPSFQLRAAPSSFFAPFCAPGLLPGEEIECCCCWWGPTTAGPRQLSGPDQQQQLHYNYFSFLPFFSSSPHSGISLDE